MADTPKTMSVHARLFVEDVDLLKRIAAEKGIPWHVELRSLVHRTLKTGTHDVVVLSEKK